MTEIQKAWVDFIAASDTFLRDDTDRPETEAALDAAAIAYFSIKQDGDTPLWAEWRLRMVDAHKASNRIEERNLFDAAEDAYSAAWLTDGPGIIPTEFGPPTRKGTQ